MNKTNSVKNVVRSVFAFFLFCIAGFDAIADHDNNIIYHNGDPMKIQSKIGVNVELKGNDADFEIIDATAENQNSTFKVKRVPDGLRTLEIDGVSVSNLVEDLLESNLRNLPFVRKDGDTMTGSLSTPRIGVLNDATVENNLTVGDLIVRNDAIVTRKLKAPNLDVANDAAVSNDLTVGNDAAISNDLEVANNAKVGNDLEVGNGLTVGSSNGNSIKVVQNGKVYIKGVGGYDGTDPSATNDLATVIADIPTKTSDLTNDGENGHDKFVTMPEVTEYLNNFVFKSLKIKGQETDDTYCLKVDSDGNIYIEKEATQNE